MANNKYTYIAILCLMSFTLLTGCSDDEYYDDYSYEDDDYDYLDEIFDFWNEEDDDSWNDYDSWDDYDDGYFEYEVPDNTNLKASDFPLGTCGELEGTTLLVSVFIDDANCSWNESDSSTINDSVKYIKLATDWISASASKYGRAVDFIYDWTIYSDLHYAGTIDTDMTNIDYGDMLDYMSWQFIDENIDSAALLQKYNANNIAYMLFINTPKRNESTSCTRDFYEEMAYPYEICYMYMFCDGEETNPATFAHEILHTFGAPDLYAEDTDGYNYGITKELVRELERTSSNDIMFTTYDAYDQTTYYDYISNDFTEVDAYYVGLIDSCDFVDEWGLKPSQH